MIKRKNVAVKALFPFQTSIPNVPDPTTQRSFPFMNPGIPRLFGPQTAAPDIKKSSFQNVFSAIDRMGGIGGIFFTINKAQKMIGMFRQISPLLKLFGSFRGATLLTKGHPLKNKGIVKKKSRRTKVLRRIRQR